MELSVLYKWIVGAITATAITVGVPIYFYETFATKELHMKDVQSIKEDIGDVKDYLYEQRTDIKDIKRYLLEKNDGS